MDFQLKAMLAIATLICATPLQAARGDHSTAADPAEVTGYTQNIVVLQGAQLIATGYTRLNEALAQLVPTMLVPRFSSTDGSDHVQTLVVNGLAPDHVVVLVDGKRRHASALLNRADAVGRGSMGPDLSMIPLSMVQRVEITQGSGAGRYGSGAIAAAINIVLKDAAEGAALNVQYGLNNGELTGVPELGRVLLDNDRVTLFTSGDRNVDDGDGDHLWLGGDWGFAIGNGGFMHLGADYRDQASTNRAGFDPREQYPRQADGSFDIREGTIDRLSHRYGQGTVDQWNVFMNVGIPLSNNIDLYSTVSYGSLLTTTTADFRRPLEDRNIPEIYPDGFLPHIHSNIDDRGLLLGVRGNHFGWDWDLSFSMQENEIDWSLKDSLNASMGALSPTSFKIGNNESRETILLLEFNRNLHWGVPIAVDLGIEALTEEFEVERGDPASSINGGVLTAAGDPRETGAQGFPGFKQFVLEEDRDVIGAFVKLDADVSDRGRITLAGRYDDYKDVGGLFSGQLLGGFDLSDAVHLRASAATGVRVARLAQSFYARSVTVFDQGVAREAGIFPAGGDVARALGGDDLKEETFRSFEAGVVARPLDSLQLSVDLYRIEIDDQVVFTETLAGDDVIGLLEAAGVNGVASVMYMMNGVDTRTQGLNLNAAYSLETGYGLFRFSLAGNVNDNKITAVADDPPQLATLGLTRFSQVSQDRLENGTPDSKAIFAVDWQREKFDGVLRATRYGKVTDAARNFELNAETILDVAFAYQATPVVKLTLGVNNLLDRQPDSFDVTADSSVFDQIYPYSGFTPWGTNGRFIYLRMNADFN